MLYCAPLTHAQFRERARTRSRDVIDRSFANPTERAAAVGARQCWAVTPGMSAVSDCDGWERDRPGAGLRFTHLDFLFWKLPDRACVRLACVRELQLTNGIFRVLSLSISADR